MEKNQVNNIVALSFCTTIFCFAICGQTETVFPRDRIIHILLSAFIGAVFIYAAQYTDFHNPYLKYLAAVAVTARMFYLMLGFSNYFHIFHGSNTMAIIIFTAVTAVMTFYISDDKSGNIHIFFLLFNIVFITLMLLFACPKINVSNIYANETSFSFEFSKLYMFFDLFTILIIVPKGKSRVNGQKKYLLYSVMFMSAATLLQGLCVRGNMMYSISPLQALFQIFSGNTIKRVDYIFAMLQTVNYFAAVILYSIAVKNVLERK